MSPGISIQPLRASAGRGVLLVLLVVIPSLAMLALILQREQGAFTYTLDDPYIHLALAHNIWHGTYGINPQEFAAPSSSILWPFLLAPFASFPAFFEYVPLGINIICYACVVLLLDAVFADLRLLLRIGVIASVILSLNIFGLIFGGMEHELQVLLVASVSYSLICRDFRGFYAAAILLPLVRYEGLAVSLPVLLYAWQRVDRRKASFSLVAIAATMLGFSWWLARHGLGYLPSSVLAKSSHQGLASTLHNFASNVKQYGFVLPVVYVLCLYHWWRDRGIALVIAAATALHLLFGRYGWYGRYEVYWLEFVVIFALRAAFDWSQNAGFRPQVVAAVGLLPVVFVPLSYATCTVPLASSNVFHQQARTAAIAKLLGEPVAVNDLGLVSLRSNVYVLDLWGLGSLEALSARMSNSDPDWIRKTMTAHNVHYAFIYEGWFPNLPDTWVKVADMKLLETRITPPGDTVSLFATDPTSAEKLRAILATYAAANSDSAFRIALL